MALDIYQQIHLISDWLEWEVHFLLLLQNFVNHMYSDCCDVTEARYREIDLGPQVLIDVKACIVWIQVQMELTIQKGIEEENRCLHLKT